MGQAVDRLFFGGDADIEKYAFHRSILISGEILFKVCFKASNLCAGMQIGHWQPALSKCLIVSMFSGSRMFLFTIGNTSSTYSLGQDREAYSF